MKKRPLRENDLLFIWRTINELRSCINKQIEAGAEGADKYSDDGEKAMKMLLKERDRLVEIMNVKLKNDMQCGVGKNNI